MRLEILAAPTKNWHNHFAARTVRGFSKCSALLCLFAAEFAKELQRPPLKGGLCVGRRNEISYLDFSVSKVTAPKIRAIPAMCMAPRCSPSRNTPQHAAIIASDRLMVAHVEAGVVFSPAI